MARDGRRWSEIARDCQRWLAMVGDTGRVDAHWHMGSGRYGEAHGPWIIWCCVAHGPWTIWTMFDAAWHVGHGRINIECLIA